MKTFAEIVEHVKQLSPAEKEELHDFLQKYLIEERRNEILENAEAGLEEYRDGKLESFSNVDELHESLSRLTPTNPCVTRDG
jgi:hypothetical protein